MQSQFYRIRFMRFIVYSNKEKRGRNLTQSYDKQPQTTDSASQSDTKTLRKRSISQRLRTDLGIFGNQGLVRKTVGFRWTLC